MLSRRITQWHWKYVTEATLVKTLEDLSLQGYEILSVQRTRRWLQACYLVVFSGREYPA
jgi:hypothetical protein